MNAIEFCSHGHPLNLRKLLAQKLCGLCGETIELPREKIEGFGYECSECDFAVHLECAKNPPSLVIEVKKIHEHPLTLLPRQVSFTCNACGVSGDKSPYVCLSCSLMIHKDCLGLPRVIKISRHQHRIALTLFRGSGDKICRVCRKRIDRRYGAYSCVHCKGYVVHTKCATRAEVWDGVELEDVPEGDEDDEIISPVKRIADNVIHHFRHQHVLRLETVDGGVIVVQPDKVRCKGCSFPIASGPFYSCIECEFSLHKHCANLPRKKTISLHQHPLILDARVDGHELSQCGACGSYFNGFIYRCRKQCVDDGPEFDVRCSSVPECVQHHLHPHPLISALRPNSICNVCDNKGRIHFLSCLECDFNMCLACATLPSEVIYKYDEHLLSHFTGENLTGLFCCDLCENKIEGKGNYYKCADCGPVLHVDCLLGSMRNIRLGSVVITKEGDKYEVILNDRTKLLTCSKCQNDCHEALIMRSTTTTTDVTTYLCSLSCIQL